MIMNKSQWSIPMRTIKPEEIKDSVFTLVGKDYFLLTAGTKDSFNTMTAGWGGLGVLWNRNVCFVYVRPTRHTYQYLEKNPTFTLSFFSGQYRETLNFCGTHSGRDTDKVKETGLTPAFTESGSVYFSEARLVIECAKIYSQDLDPSAFLDQKIEKNYPGKDYHRLYIGEIVTCMER